MNTFNKHILSSKFSFQYFSLLFLSLSLPISFTFNRNFYPTIRIFYSSKYNPIWISNFDDCISIFTEYLQLSSRCIACCIISEYACITYRHLCWDTIYFFNQLFVHKWNLYILWIIYFSRKLGAFHPRLPIAKARTIRYEVSSTDNYVCVLYIYIVSTTEQWTYTSVRVIFFLTLFRNCAV